MYLSITIKKQSLLLIFILLFSVTLHSQFCEPIIESKYHIKKGYYFMEPYNMNIPVKNLDTINTQYIINVKGELVFFRKTKYGSDFKIQSNGLMSYWHGNKFYLLNQKFQLIDSISCVNGLETDSHDFLILPNGHYLLCGKENEIQDLSNIHLFTSKHLTGSKRAIVKYDVIQELDKNKKLVFEWKSKPFFNLLDINTIYLSDTVKQDVTHFNSIDDDLNGNILVSFRYFDQIVKINKKTGAIIWRMGGKNNNMKYLNDSIPFLGQHSALFTNLNTISIFDNGYSYDSLKHNVRGLEYEIDDIKKTAKLMWYYSNKYKITSIATGNFKRNKNGISLINYGKTNKGAINITCELINQKKEVIQTLSFKDTIGTYRAFFYTKLPFKLKQEPLIISKKDNVYTLSTKRKYNYYLWSTGETTAQILITNFQNQYVFVSNDGINYTRSKSIR